MGVECDFKLCEHVGNMQTLSSATTHDEGISATVPWRRCRALWDLLGHERDARNIFTGLKNPW